jgi:phosphoribosylaminoimidazole-succinocarboxamide synthase
MHKAQINPNLQIVERKQLGERHALINEEVRRYEEGEDVPDELRERVAVAKQEMLNDQRTTELNDAFQSFGILADDAAVNFGEDESGNVVYVDTFDPWQKRKNGVLKPGFDVVALSAAIDRLTDENQKDMTRRWLDRLQEIFIQEEQAGQQKKAA